LNNLFETFGRVEIIHLPSRTDRFLALKRELASCGFDIGQASIPAPAMPSDPEGFPSRAIYGNFLSHLDILERALRDNLPSVLVLEDDAMFSNLFRRSQRQLADRLASTPWDIAYIGHSIIGEHPSGTGLVPFNGDLLWAHCYAVHQRALPSLISFLRRTIELPGGKGGKMYIDAALNTYRKANADTRTLVSRPCLSVQRGSSSSIAGNRWRSEIMSPVVQIVRSVRDECWRRGIISISHK
jgi:glycosyl transferase, family 25